MGRNRYHYRAHLVTVLDVSSLVPRPIWVLGYDVSSGVARLLVLAGHLLYASLLASHSRALRARLRDMSGTALAGHVPAQARPSLQWRSQVTDDARALHAFFFVAVGGEGGRLGACWGHAPLVTYCILEVATQMRLFLKCRRSLESGVVLTHDFAIRACSTGLHQR